MPARLTTASVVPRPPHFQSEPPRPSSADGRPAPRRPRHRGARLGRRDSRDHTRHPFQLELHLAPESPAFRLQLGDAAFPEGHALTGRPFRFDLAREWTFDITGP